MKKTIIGTLALCGVLALSGGVSVFADEVKEKGNTYWVVKPGDTLSGIADEYETNFEVLHGNNDFIDNADVILVGDKVLVGGKDFDKEKMISYTPAPTYASEYVEDIKQDYIVSTQPQVEQQQAPAAPSPAPVVSGGLAFDGNGLLVEQASGLAQTVINQLLAIPGHANGAGYHGPIDANIDQLSTPEAVYVIHRIEGPGFGQTGDGYAGQDTAAAHQTFVNNQVNNRFGGSVHALLKAWGTFSYGGY